MQSAAEKILWNAIRKDIPEVLGKLREINIRIERPAHPWRICPPGEHYVRPATVKEHLREGHPVREHPRRDYCRENESTSKDTLTTSEIADMSELFFGENKFRPKAVDWEFGPDGDRFDVLIGGWTKYWNDIFAPNPPLDPNVVKALAASESSFRSNIGKGKRGGAKGLMQLLPSTIDYLRGGSNELKDHILQFDSNDVFDPNVNIAGGVRWLFRKRELASNRLGRPATWIETVAEYKDYLRRSLKDPKATQKGMVEFNRYLALLEGRKKEK